jgi:aconitate hydratase
VDVRIKNRWCRVSKAAATLSAGRERMRHDAAMVTRERVPVILAGQNTAPDSAIGRRGTNLLGVKAVIAQSFERIHRSNLVGMGVLPLQFHEGTNTNTLKLDGSESYAIAGLRSNLKPQQELTLRITRKEGSVQDVPVRCRIDTPIEIDYYQHGHSRMVAVNCG